MDKILLDLVRMMPSIGECQSVKDRFEHDSIMLNDRRS